MKNYIAFDTFFMRHNMNRIAKEMLDKQRLRSGDFRFWRQTDARSLQIRFKQYLSHLPVYKVGKINYICWFLNLNKSICPILHTPKTIDVREEPWRAMASQYGA